LENDGHVEYLLQKGAHRGRNVSESGHQHHGPTEAQSDKNTLFGDVEGALANVYGIRHATDIVNQ